ncbi:high-affinity iron permease [Hesseltinella vesiculosa]|uniref:High-affinity iron permease n=1 Tax=Hesseltinella vesiculosa TaxID=101127 RepID=A0A1X2GAB6_9FUNG|nr:high-affinity iron permease [Hesseltinella vesiculosa]
MAEDLFNVPIFFILFRETTEAAIIVSVLLTFLMKTFDKQSPLYRRLRNQIWVGAAAGFAICLCIGAAFIAVWYTQVNDLWGNSEDLWEGIFSLIAVVMITLMGIAFLRTEKLQDKWKLKLAKVMEDGGKKDKVIEEGGKFGKMFKRKTFKAWMQRYSFLILPFVTVLREGLEAVVFIGGVSLNASAKSIPIAVIMGIICGLLVGFLIYRGGSLIKLRWFFIVSTCILYLVSAGLMAKAVGFFEQYSWNQVIGGEAAEGGDVIDYKVTTAVWHTSWGNPEQSTSSNGGWQIFNAILGWNNTATIGTITSYCLYWLLIGAYLVYLHFKERRLAIAKAKRGQFQLVDADLPLEMAKAFVTDDGNVKVEANNAMDEKHKADQKV